MELFRLFVLTISLFSISGLDAQLSAIQKPETILPVSASACYVDSPNQKKPLKNLKALMLSPSISIDETGFKSSTLAYQPHLAFFCRVEVKIDKAVGTPFRFRLGSVDYVDYLEGKRSTY